jgi:hypothetical protein
MQYPIKKDKCLKGAGVEPYTREMHEQFVQAEEERKGKEEQARREKSEKDSARKAWLADGGREMDFERQWPSIRDEARKQRVMSADREARQSMRARGVSRI